MNNLLNNIRQAGTGSPLVDGGAQGSLGMYAFPYDALLNKGDESSEGWMGKRNC
ncbi:hypothetical protein [Chryseolinea lacunae]|uniref:Uncharacterized protein n=1 Tax=Chryseolinea lacunae TaxID=2801331 RepID=A0ABS1L355_9BACT|nr:hypothetical protein [Chryseolinea lacunae]MBL0744981.1 hypothetical protein [Chryseolinea lacunae]